MMKNKIVRVIFFLAICSATTQTPILANADDDLPQIVLSPSDVEIVREGPANDRRFIARLEGYFVNTCYRESSLRVRLDYDSQDVFIDHLGHEDDGVCLQVLTEYKRDVPVGNFSKSGVYHVWVKDTAKSYLERGQFIVP